MTYHLAQLNVAKFRLPMDHPTNADFINSLDHVNAMADVHPGFVWRLEGEGYDAIDVQAFDDPNIIVNMSVWTDIESLEAYVYRSPAHLEVMRRRREWFEKMKFYMVLWWVKAGHAPTVEEAKDRLTLLEAQGPSPEAFTFQKPFSFPGADALKSSEPV